MHYGLSPVSRLAYHSKVIHNLQIINNQLISDELGKAIQKHMKLAAGLAAHVNSKKRLRIQ